MKRAASIALAPLSGIYSGLVRTGNALYRREVFRALRVDAPVISVGNLTTGGTGKTPLVEWIARELAANGRRVGRIEEVRAEHRGGEYQIVEYRLGSGAVMERWSVIRNLFGIKTRMLIARWNQVDISDPRRPRLTCPLDEIKREDEIEREGA